MDFKKKFFKPTIMFLINTQLIFSTEIKHSYINIDVKNSNTKYEVACHHSELKHNSYISFKVTKGLIKKNDTYNFFTAKESIYRLIQNKCSLEIIKDNSIEVLPSSIDIQVITKKHNKLQTSHNNLLESISLFSRVNFKQDRSLPLVNESDANEYLNALDEIEQKNIKERSFDFQIPGDNIQSVSSFKFLKLLTSLEYIYNTTDNLYTNYTWYDQIPIKGYSKSKLYIGAIPLYSKSNPFKNYFHKLRKINIQTVLSLVEPFELQFHRKNMSPVLYFTHDLIPITPDIWQEVGIKQKVVSTPDFLPVSLEKINSSVDFIHQQLTENKNIYVHCKAGRGRSAMVIIAFLIKYNHLTLDQALEKTIRHRPQININQVQLKALQDYEQNLKFNLHTSKEEEIESILTPSSPYLKI